MSPLTSDERTIRVRRFPTTKSTLTKPNSNLLSRFSPRPRPKSGSLSQQIPEPKWKTTGMGTTQPSMDTLIILTPATGSSTVIRKKESLRTYPSLQTARTILVKEESSPLKILSLTVGSSSISQWKPVLKPPLPTRNESWTWVRTSAFVLSDVSDISPEIASERTILLSSRSPPLLTFTSCLKT